MELFRIILSAFPTTANVGVRDIVQHVCTLSPGVRMSITQVCSLVRLLLVKPATNAVSERSASALRRVKSYLRTTMTDSRLNNLLVLHVHKDRCDSLVLEDCLNEFVCCSEHRLSLFGKFDFEIHALLHYLVKLQYNWCWAKRHYGSIYNECMLFGTLIHYIWHHAGKDFIAT